MLAGRAKGGRFGFVQRRHAAGPPARAVLAVRPQCMAEKCNRHLVVLRIGFVRNQRDWRRAHIRHEGFSNNRGSSGIVRANVV